MHRNPSRPLSPHLSIWRWGPHMLVSILHRVTGTGLATLGAVLFTWWLAAAASGPEAYDTFSGVVSWLMGSNAASNQGLGDWIVYIIGLVVGIGLTWAFFQHTASGLRHFVLDMGAGYELGTNKFWANVTVAASVVLTALTWLYILGVRT